MPAPHPHPDKNLHCVHPTTFTADGSDQGFFIYGEKLKKKKVTGVRLESHFHTWTKRQIEETTNEYIDLTVNVSHSRRKPTGRPKTTSSDDVTITLEFEDGTLSDPITIGNVVFDDSFWLAEQKRKQAAAKKKAAKKAGAKKPAGKKKAGSRGKKK